MEKEKRNISLQKNGSKSEERTSEGGILVESEGIDSLPRSDGRSSRCSLRVPGEGGVLERAQRRRQHFVEQVPCACAPSIDRHRKRWGRARKERAAPTSRPRTGRRVGGEVGGDNDDGDGGEVGDETSRANLF